MANIEYIHSNKLAKWNYEYTGSDGIVYIGQKDGRLKKKETVVAETTATTAPASTFIISGNSGDVDVTTEENNALMPFLLMGC